MLKERKKKERERERERERRREGRRPGGRKRKVKKEELKCSLFADDRIVYIENSKESTKINS